MIMPVIGIVTVTYNSSLFLAEFFSSLRRQSFTSWLTFIIDNDSKDGTSEAIKTAGLNSEKFFLLENFSNIGIAAGNNQGIRKALSAGCEYILLLNNDTYFDSDFIRSLIGFCEKDNALVVVPKILYDKPAGTIWYGGGGFDKLKGYTGYHSGIGEQDKGQFDTRKRVDYSPTCCMLIHKSVFKRIGLMDERYFVYFDDTDFCLRLKRAKINIWYEPSASLVHKVGGSTGGVFSIFTCRYTSRNRLLYLRKNFGHITMFFWAPIFLCYYIAKYLVRRNDLERFTACLKGTLEAFKRLV